ncbi:hypothetical protein [Antrihabitans cavernicola]|uniref:Ada DNA repair metal-binding domain-containing protein n=1 Tax=Antrihabitans cavernicola TaxID=2495913 RepID=A0A5A7SGP7_9NOCA|nr:hypothetical protein [Spelaeibacter cavernicola]KAA0025016.1 hypothetical protein FOY51_03640 [Spelaeibacter cavernicola]
MPSAQYCCVVAHRNRVDPFGEITAEPYRGAWMGNRGGAIDVGSHRRQWASKAWIYCHLKFKTRTTVFRDPSRKYTELFFFDEAVALTAGHRPCGQCQHDRLAEFKIATLGRRASVGDIDDVLHRERRGDRDITSIGSLPSGTFVDVDGPTLLLDGRALRWSPNGYVQLAAPGADTTVPVLTPALIRTALARGFVPTVSE